MIRDAYAGIDVAVTRTKRLPISVVTRIGDAVVPLPLKEGTGPRPPKGPGNAVLLEPSTAEAYASAALGYLREVERMYGVRIRRVAIDAPSAPRRDSLPLRHAESVLKARSISYFKTPTASEFDEIVDKGGEFLGRGGAAACLPNANRIWMLAGFALFQVMCDEFECIEVYPHATAHALGVAQFSKQTKCGLAAQLKAVAEHTGWPDLPGMVPLSQVGFGSRDDKLDAYSSAWIASLPESEREPLGEPPDDVIWVPRVKRLCTGVMR